jgi:hypothetical protein
MVVVFSPETSQRSSGELPPFARWKSGPPHSSTLHIPSPPKLPGTGSCPRPLPSSAAHHHSTTSAPPTIPPSPLPSIARHLGARTARRAIRGGSRRVVYYTRYYTTFYYITQQCIIYIMPAGRYAECTEDPGARDARSSCLFQSMHHIAGYIRYIVIEYDVYNTQRGIVSSRVASSPPSAAIQPGLQSRQAYIIILYYHIILIILLYCVNIIIL